MDSLHQKYKLVKKIKDPKFEIDRLEYYSLSLYLGNRDFQILVIDHELQLVVLLEDYVFDPKMDEESRKGIIKFIFDDHHLLLANFWRSINFIVKNKKFSYIPFDYFDETKAATYLSVNADFDPELEEIMLSYHKEFNAVNVFAVPQDKVELLSTVYPNKKINYFHQSSVIIAGFIAASDSEERDIAVYIDRLSIHVIVLENEKLSFYNQYQISKFNDYTRFVKIVGDELNFDLKKNEIKLYGYLGYNTPHYQELKKTMKRLDFGVRATNIKLGHVFDELQEHQYFDVFSANMMRI